MKKREKCFEKKDRTRQKFDIRLKKVRCKIKMTLNAYIDYIPVDNIKEIIPDK